MRRRPIIPPPTATTPTIPALPPPDQRLAVVHPGPDVLLTSQAETAVDEWITGWGTVDQLKAADIPPPGPLFLHGPSGTGKTSLTRMIASRFAGVRQVFVIDAMRVTEGFLGATSANIAQASERAIHVGAVLVLEEIDTLASHRMYESSSAVENSRSATSIMRVIELAGPIILTSNRLDVIDPAVIRRCEYIIEMPDPTPEQRRAIVERELGADPGPVTLSLSVAIPLARRARRAAFISVQRIHGPLKPDLHADLSKELAKRIFVDLCAEVSK